MKKKLFIIDVLNCAYRLFHTSAGGGAKGIPLKTSAGRVTGVTYGMAKLIGSLVKSEKPDLIVAALDSREKNNRRDLYPNYKANRSAMPDLLREQLLDVDLLFSAWNIPSVRAEGYEADDVVGSLVSTFEASGYYDIYIVSGDKDFFQVVSENTFLYSQSHKPTTDHYQLTGSVYQKLGIEACIQKFGVTPEKVVEVLALMGDSSDNVPGVPGIGEKGARTLISEYGSLEKIYENIASIAPDKLRAKLDAGRDLAMLSRKLVTIVRDLDLSEYFTNVLFSCERPATVDDFYRKLEFRL